MRRWFYQNLNEEYFYVGSPSEKEAVMRQYWGMIGAVLGGRI
jgi:hypothetical protein